MRIIKAYEIVEIGGWIYSSDCLVKCINKNFNLTIYSDAAQVGNYVIEFASGFTIAVTKEKFDKDFELIKGNFYKTNWRPLFLKD